MTNNTAARPNTAARKAQAAQTAKAEASKTAATKANVEATRCRCGCGERTNPRNPARVYRPGHDARHAGQAGRAAATLPPKEREAVLLKAFGPATTPLGAKARGVAQREADRLEAKAAREAAKSNAA